MREHWEGRLARPVVGDPAAEEMVEMGFAAGAVVASKLVDLVLVLLLDHD